MPARPRRLKNTILRPGTKVVGSPFVADLDGDLARERGLGEGGKRVEAHHMILAKAGGPRRLQRQHVLAHALTCLELGTMALLVVEADSLHAGETLERPGQTDGRVLSSGEQDEGAVGVH
jgi:hypothetical protein